MSQPPVINDFVNNVLPAIGGMPALDLAVQSALAKAPATLKIERISSGESFIDWMTKFLRWVPTESTDSTLVLRKLSVFYFILDREPIVHSQTAVYPNSVGNGLSILSQWIVDYAKALGQWLDDPASLTAASFRSFKAAPLYRIWECDSPDGEKYATFNDFFGRNLAEDRQVDEPGDNRVPVYPADSKWDSCFDVDMGSNTWIPAVSRLETLDPAADPKGIIADTKGWMWSVGALLEDSPFASSFAGGVWVHSFLNVYNYHHFRSPVSGTVVDARVIQNAAYLDVVATADGIIPRRRIGRGLLGGVRGRGADNVRAEVSPEDGSGYQFLQTRGCVVIDTSGSEEGDIGLVAVLPIGMAQVSSVQLSVQPSDKIQKGGEFGVFQFGGSDIVTVFQAKAGLSADTSLFNTDPSYDEQGKRLDYTFYGSRLVREPLSPK
ncbi:hypothetical protein OQA88_5510 [Cercophora sp. LCS_1]